MERPREGFWFIILGIFFGNFVALLNSGTVTVALPFIMKELQIDVSIVQWIVTGYLLAMGMIVPLVGFLGDRFSYKRLYVAALIGFVLTSALCGFSWNISSLITFRILQGIFSGIVLPTTMTIIYQAIEKEKQPLAISLWSVAAMFAPAVGPTLGGFLTQYFGWKALFFMNLPIGILAIGLAIFFIPTFKLQESKSLDILGLIAAMILSISLMIYFSQGNKIGWLSERGIFWLLSGLVSIMVFIWRELTAKTPLLNIRVFKYSAFTFGTVVNCLLNIGLYAGTFLVPIFMNNALGASSLSVGLVMFPGTVLMILTSLLCGRYYYKIQPVWLLLTGVMLLTIATWEFSHLSVTTTYTFIVCWLLFRYAGLGFATTSITSLSMNDIPKSDVGHASSILNWLRSVFASLAIGVFSSIYSARTQTHLSELSNVSVKSTIQQSASVLAMNDTFLTATFIMIAAIPFIFLLKRRGGLNLEG